MAMGPDAFQLFDWFLSCGKVRFAPPFLTSAALQTMTRFTNNIDVTSFNGLFPEKSKDWGPGHEIINFCDERPKRNNGTQGKGRGLSVHHHGMPTLPGYDGFADDVFCKDEVKDYVLSNDFPSTFWCAFAQMLWSMPCGSVMLSVALARTRSHQP